MKKIINLFLVLLMVFCLTGCKKANGSATVLYVNDVHTYIDNEHENEDKEMVRDLSYASLKAMKDDLTNDGENVILVDAGDFVQGTYFGGIDEGKSVIEITNAVGFDVATIGNHEFDYGQFAFFEDIEAINYPIVSCNFYKLEDNSLVLPAYEVIEKGGIKIAFVGITTPESITKSSPAYFMDANNNYIYNFYAGEDGQELYDAVQKAVDAASKEADVVIGLAHLGVDDTSKPYTSKDVIANTTGLDAIIDGHSHHTIESEIVTNKNGENVLLTQTGSYFDNIGKMNIDVVDGVVSIKTELIDEYENRDSEIDALESALIKKVDDALGETVCESEVELLIKTDGGEGDRIVRKEETNIGDLFADAIYWYFNEVEGLDCDVAITNGGNVRDNLHAGPITYEDIKKVQPFGNVDCMLEIDGQTLLDALEFCSRTAPDDECGGFIIPAGLKFSIKKNVVSTVQFDENQVYTGAPTGEYRVCDVEVYNKETKAYEPLDLTKKYTVAGINYTLRNYGDGCTMFADNGTLVKDYVSEDYLIDAAYMQAFKDQKINTANSPLSSYKNYLLDYENPNGSGRITIIEE